MFVGPAAGDLPNSSAAHRYQALDFPTNQNHNSIQKDFEALVPQILNRPEHEIKLLLEMPVRPYAPCISCSAHMLNVEFL